MLLKERAFLAALDKPDEAVRLWLACGRDASGAAELARLARAALAPSSDQVIHIDSAELEANPGCLVDAACALSLFGSRQLIRIDDASDRILTAVRLLLEAPTTANPVVIAAGDLAKSSPLLELATRHPLARAVQAWPLGPEAGRDRVADAARAAGLRLASDQHEALWAAADGDPQRLAREIEKLATATEATPAAPRDVPADLFQALVSGTESESIDRLIVALIRQDARALDRELTAHGSASLIPLLRAAGRRLLLLQALRRAMDKGASPRAAVEARRPPVSPRELRDALATALPRWPMARIESALATLVAAERAMKAPASAGDVLARAALVAIAASPPAALGLFPLPS